MFAIRKLVGLLTVKFSSGGLLGSATKVSEDILEFFYNPAVGKLWVIKDLTTSLSNQSGLLGLRQPDFYNCINLVTLLTNDLKYYSLLWVVLYHEKQVYSTAAIENGLEKRIGEVRTRFFDSLLEVFCKTYTIM